MTLTLPCPAKINLFLRVLRKRPDGLHELGSLFEAVESGDVLSAELWNGIEIMGAGGITENPEDNLIFRAAHLLQTRYADRLPPGSGLRFSLRKSLPMGAGLGGGSSDAATALRLANALWNLNLTPAELRSAGAELGSDVPFFLGTPSAFAESRGERLSPAPQPYPFHVLIATPDCHVDTAWAYGQLARTDEISAGPAWPFFKGFYGVQAKNPDFYANLHNDFEAPVSEYFPQIREIRDILNTFSPTKALLTGSGASLFALFRDETEAKACLEAVAPRCRFSILTRFWEKPEFF